MRLRMISCKIQIQWLFYDYIFETINLQMTILLDLAKIWEHYIDKGLRN